MKLGSIHKGIERERAYSNVFEEITYKNWTKCMLVSSSGSLSDLMSVLGKEIRGSWYILYVLLITRCDNKPGRYQGIEINDYDGVVALFNKYKEYFDGDGRHNIWIGSTTSNDLLVYDKHDVIYAYGPIEKYKSRLMELGYINASVLTPVPHKHHYNMESDNLETAILKECDWKWFELNESDDK